jgi:hypothetical protein
MRPPKVQRITEKSEINYSYKTIRVTKSRIEKGLIAIPRLFNNYLPKSSQMIKIYLSDSITPVKKNFSSFFSSTNENRIGGLKNWFIDNQIQEGDEIVLQMLDKEKFIYRILKEKDFLKHTKDFQMNFDNAKDEKVAAERIEQISNLVQVEKESIAFNEFLRLVSYSTEEIRKRIEISHQLNKEKTPPNIRLILEKIYGGYCQVCSFSFLKKDSSPYYEIHHLLSDFGHHPKNLVLVCANCHRQFEYANVIKEFNNNGWLIKVIFNRNDFIVKQVINQFEKQEFLKTVFI